MPNFVLSHSHVKLKYPETHIFDKYDLADRLSSYLGNLLIMNNTNHNGVEQTLISPPVARLCHKRRGTAAVMGNDKP